MVFNICKVLNLFQWPETYFFCSKNGKARFNAQPILDVAIFTLYEASLGKFLGMLIIGLPGSFMTRFNKRCSRLQGKHDDPGFTQTMSCSWHSPTSRSLGMFSNNTATKLDSLGLAV